MEMGSTSSESPVGVDRAMQKKEEHATGKDDPCRSLSSWQPKP